MTSFITDSIPITTFDDGRWYKDAIIYQLHVRAFFDSDGDGIGDFRGLAQKLDYIQDLGVTALWLLPFYPSPLRDDGYDIADYRDVHPNYGTLKDFQAFLREAHARGLKVITEIVLNHTSDQHPWFQRARRAPPGIAWRNFYVWSDTPERYVDARIIFQDFETSNWTWDAVAKAVLLAPLLLAISPISTGTHRTCATPCSARSISGCAWASTVCGSTPFPTSTSGRARNVREPPRDPRRSLTAAPRSTSTSATRGACCSPRPTSGRRTPSPTSAGRRRRVPHGVPLPADATHVHGDRDGGPLPGHRHPPADAGHSRDTSQWAMFLRNHDELTLEMVTDEERDYMYRVYADDPQARASTSGSAAASRRCWTTTGARSNS